MMNNFDLYMIECMELFKVIRKRNIDFDETIVGTRIHSNNMYCSLIDLSSGDFLFNWYNSYEDSVSPNFVFPNMDTAVINSGDEDIKMLDHNEAVAIDVSISDMLNSDDYNENHFRCSTVYNDRVSSLICLSFYSRNIIKELNRRTRIGISYRNTSKIDFEKEVQGIHFLKSKIGLKSWAF